MIIKNVNKSSKYICIILFSKVSSRGSDDLSNSSLFVRWVEKQVCPIFANRAEVIMLYDMRRTNVMFKEPK